MSYDEIQKIVNSPEFNPVISDQFPRGSLRGLSHLENLNSLVLKKGCTDDKIDCIGDIKSLSVLCFDACPITNEGLQNFLSSTNLPNLRTLKIRNNKNISDYGIAALSGPQWSGLESLDFTGCCITDGQLKLITQPHLKEITTSSGKVIKR